MWSEVVLGGLGRADLGGVCGLSLGWGQMTSRGVGAGYRRVRQGVKPG